jgi:hypothetical protein
MMRAGRLAVAGTRSIDTSMHHQRLRHTLTELADRIQGGIFRMVRRVPSVVRTSVASLALLSLAGGLVYAFFGNPLDPFDDRAFTPTAWYTADEDGRARVSRDLVTRLLTPGTRASRVVALLDDAYIFIQLDRDDRIIKAEIYGY